MIMPHSIVISIVVPIYNVEKYLNECLDSILIQTFADWECILVDDGSTDESGVICDEYVEKDCRFRVIHKENGGVSNARNVGIQTMRGRYCCFVDSDDWIEKTYLSNFILGLDKSPDLVIQSFVINDSVSKRQREVVLPDMDLMNTCDVVAFLEKYPGVHNGFLWHRLFRSDIIISNGILFSPNLSFAEDGLFFFQYMAHVKTTKVMSKIGYHYIIRGNSLTQTGHQLPKETYVFLLKNYIESLLVLQIMAPNKAYYLNVVKAYACRLSINWFIRNAYTRPCEKEWFLDELIKLNEKYHFFNAKGITPSQHLLIWGMKLPKGLFQDGYMALSLWLMKNEVRVFRVLRKK